MIRFSRNGRFQKGNWFEHQAMTGVCSRAYSTGRVFSGRKYVAGIKTKMKNEI